MEASRRDAGQGLAEERDRRDEENHRQGDLGERLWSALGGGDEPCQLVVCHLARLLGSCHQEDGGEGSASPRPRVAGGVVCGIGKNVAYW